MPSALLAWRKRFRERFELIAQRYPPKIPVDFDALADMMSGLVDGGIILSRVLKDKESPAQAGDALPRFCPRGVFRNWRRARAKARFDLPMMLWHPSAA